TGVYGFAIIGLPTQMADVACRNFIHSGSRLQFEWSLVMTEKIWAALSNELADAAATVGKSVVAVLAGRHPGSGIVWTNDSVVTANHAVRRDEEIAVITSAGQEVAARVMGRDASTDLAV